MEKLNDLEDLFHHQLKDLYSAETQLINALPEMVNNATNEDLKSAFSEHLEETKGHKERLEEIAEELDMDPTGETCDAMKGLINEAQSFISEDAEPEVQDAGIIADGQRVEHYEISSYGSAIRFAERLDYNDTVDRLSATLDEEKNADQTLNQVAESEVNKQALEGQLL